MNVQCFLTSLSFNKLEKKTVYGSVNEHKWNNSIKTMTLWHAQGIKLGVVELLESEKNWADNVSFVNCRM